MIRLAAMASCLVLLAGHVACSRADVYPVTRDSPLDDGGAGSAGRGGGSEGGDAGEGGEGGDASEGGVGGETSSCLGAEAVAGDSVRTLLVGGTRRSYVLHVPPAYDGLRPAPLVLDFHGIGESGTSQLTSSPYPAHLDPEGVVMAFPDGMRGPAGTGWNVGPCCVADVDDVAFVRAVVADVQGVACVDASRVYAVGVLTGGGMAHYLGCHAADVFAGVAPAAFDLLEENLEDCEPALPISVVSFRGTANSRVPYEGGASALVPGMPLTFLGARATFEAWAELDGCTGSPSPADANGCSSYTGCAGGVEVMLCTKQGGGEDPGDPSIAWPLLSRHTR